MEKSNKKNKEKLFCKRCNKYIYYPAKYANLKQKCYRCGRILTKAK